MSDLKVKKVFFSILKFDKVIIKKLFVFAVFLGTFELTIPFAVQAIINRIYKTYQIDPVIFILIIVAIFLLIQSSYLFFRFILVEEVQKKIMSRISHSLALSLKSKQKLQSYEYITRFFESVSLKKNIAKFLVGGLSLVLSLIFGSGILLFYHPFFAILIIFLCVSFFILVKTYHKRTSETSIVESKYKYKLAGKINNYILSDENQITQVENEISAYLDKRNHHFFYLKKQYFGMLLIYISCHLILLGVGGTLVLNGELSVGQLVASELIFSVILSVLAKSIEYIEVYYDCIASLDKVSFIDVFSNKSFEKENLKLFQGTYRFTKLVLILLPIILAFLPWVQTSEGYGTLRTFNPEDRVQDISSFVDGRIKKWFVREGQEVKQGDPLAEIIDNDPDYVNRLKSDRDASLKKYDAERLAAETALLDFNRQKSLYDQGLTSRVKLEKAKINYHKLIAKEAEAASKLAQVEVKYSRQQRQLVLAPSNGYVQQLYSGNTSSIIKKGTRIAVFVPKTIKPAVELFVDGNDVPLIHKGRRVQLEFEGFPALQFSGWPGLGLGTFEGVVTSLDSTLSSNGKFRVMVEPVDISKWPDAKILRRGTKVLGWVQMNTVTLIYELWRQFNGFPARPDDLALGKKEKKK